MKRLLLVGGVLSGFAIGLPVHAQNFPMGVIFGMGQESCGRSLLDPSLKLYAESWILGFWSGQNALGTNHRVGYSTDAEGIFAAVETECDKDPTLPLLGPASTVYARLFQENR